MQNRFVIIAVAVVVLLLTIRACAKKDYTSSYEESPVVQYQYEIIQDTLTTIVTETKIDTVLVEIEERINSAMQFAETAVREVVKERDSVVLKIVELEQVKRVTLYDTVKTIIQMPPDSVTLYNIFEYESSDGLVVTTKRDTIQSRRVTRAYAQRFIMN